MLFLMLRVNLGRGETMRQTPDITSGSMRAMRARWRAARSRWWGIRAVAGAVLAVVAFPRSVPAQATPVARRACGIQVSHALAMPGAQRQGARGDAIVYALVIDPAGKPIEGARVALQPAAIAWVTGPQGELVFRIPPQLRPVGDSVTVDVRRVGYPPVHAPVLVAPGDTITAVLCVIPVGPLPMEIVRAKRETNLGLADTTRHCASVASVIRQDTTGRAASTPGNAIIRVHVTDSAGATTRPIVISAHVATADGGLGSALTGGYTDQHGDVTLTVPASRLGRGTSVVVVVRQISYYAAHATVQLAPGDTVDVKAALCGGAPFLSEAVGEDSVSARSERLSKAGEGRISALPLTSPRSKRCRTTGDEALVLVAYARMLAAETSREMQVTRKSYHIPPTDTANVELVTEDAVCARAGDAFNADLPPSLRIANRAVYVVRIGQVYIATDPAAQPVRGGLVPNIVFDGEFRVLARFAA